MLGWALLREFKHKKHWLLYKNDQTHKNRIVIHSYRDSLSLVTRGKTYYHAIYFCSWTIMFHRPLTVLRSKTDILSTVVTKILLNCWILKFERPMVWLTDLSLSLKIYYVNSHSKPLSRNKLHSNNFSFPSKLFSKTK